ncbi:MAG: hypothetical protein KatS3mg008_0693 [Acidimicrobiales bacterium]|nr:MAG: hypothetical protein KatS3mg008_0693 [Acidimicrobiales bacterium]
MSDTSRAPKSAEGVPGDDELAATVALASLPEVGPKRLALLLALGPGRAWEAILDGDRDTVAKALGRHSRRLDDITRRWCAAARIVDPREVLDRHRSAGVTILTPRSLAWPKRLSGDPDPPPVLFAKGDVSVLENRCAAVVGTRRCTPYGRGVARRLGSELAEAGVTVVSGLARGIDTEAHRGVLGAGGRPAGVVGSGLDVPYPSANRDLWSRVGSEGVLLSEHPLGVGPRQWHFPARNRLIAGLAEVVVVVESHRHSGTHHTVDEALVRDRPVMAVPGPVTSPASDGTNALLVECAVPARDALDVLCLLGLGGGRSRCVESSSVGRSSPGAPKCPPDDASSRSLLDALASGPAPPERLAVLTGMSPSALASCLERLVQSGAVAEEGGWYSLC